MSAIFEAWHEFLEEGAEAGIQAADVPEQAPASATTFADEQLVGLVHRLFLAGWPKSMRQVVFAGAGEDAGSARICRRVAETLAEQIPGRVCLLETDRSAENAISDSENSSAVGASQLKKNLRLLAASAWRSIPGSLPQSWMRRRLGDLRSEFDYTVIHAPPLGVSSETETLARLTDGVVLVLEAHRTRRVLARATQQKLRAAGVQVLGAILNGRTFPIPERIYRRF